MSDPIVPKVVLVPATPFERGNDRFAFWIPSLRCPITLKREEFYEHHDDATGCVNYHAARKL